MAKQLARGLALAALSLALGLQAVPAGAESSSDTLSARAQQPLVTVPPTTSRPAAGIQGAVAIAKPDLVIGEVQAVPGDDRKLSVRLINQGTGGAGPTNLKLFYHRSGKVMVRGTFVPPIAAGADLWVVADIGSPLAYASAVSLRVDDPNRIAELSEGNNGHIWK